MKYVIIGNSAAAVGCVEGIRQFDQEGSIALVSDERHHTYSRPLISYLLYGKTDEQRMKYRPDDFYEKNQVTTYLGHKAEKIDKDQKKVLLDDGTALEYDKLLVATGSRPFVPPMNGLDKVEKVFSFMTLDDAHALAEAINKDSKVLVIGAGLIGLKCVEGICDRVAEVTVIDLAQRILPSILDEDGSALVQKHIEEKGVKFILGDSVAEFTSDTTAVSKNGLDLSFDVVVVAVGVRPNVNLVQEIGGEVNRGIVTNEKCQTSIEDIFAAGDCTESYDITADQMRILALLPNAYMQGETAGITMAGGEKNYDKAIPMNAIGFFGYHIITAGSYDGEAYIKKDGDSYKKLVTRDDKLVGYILIGNVQRAGIYTSLIREQKKLSTIDFDLIKEKPQLMAFSKRERAKTLGGLK